MSVSTPGQGGRGLRHRLLHLRARLWLSLGRAQPALADYQRLLDRAPDDAHARASRAHLLARAGHREAALADLRALVVQQPQAATAWFNLGYLLEAGGDLDEAVAAFRQALALEPRLDRAAYGLGLALIGLRRLDEAVPALEQATRLQPMSPAPWLQLGRLQAERGEPAAARAVLERLRGFEPRAAEQLARDLAGPPTAFGTRGR